MAKKGTRKIIGLVSETSCHRTYYTTKSSMNTPEKLRIRKYDPVARTHAWYEETKKNLGRNTVNPKK